MSLADKLPNPFLPIEDRIKLEASGRTLYQKNRLSFGVSFLDDVAGGIFPNDLIVITAKTGVGKSELATIIAQENAIKGKKIHYFALEAEPQEIERRMKFKRLSDAFYIQKEWRKEEMKPNYMDWVQGKQSVILDKFEAEIDDILKVELKNFFTRYRTTKFGIEEFRREVQLVANETDLVIIDHLHYFDLEDDNENRELKKIVKDVRDVALLIGKPVILLAHVRKGNKGFLSLVPDEEDIMGTSDIPKISTRCISIAPAFDQAVNDSWVFPTYCRLTKNRLENGRTRWTGLLFYNTRQNRYEERYLLGKLNLKGDEFIQEDPLNYPHWARRPKSEFPPMPKAPQYMNRSGV